MVKILLGVPCNWRGMPPPFVDSMMLMDKSYMGYYARARSGSVARMRNDLVVSLLETDCTHLMMCDADGVIPRNAMLTLLEANLPVVGGIQWGHNPPYLFSVFKERVRPYLSKSMEIPLTTIEQVYAIGFPAVLIRRDVLEQLEHPIFEYKYLTESDGADEQDVGKIVSTDKWFAEMCYRKGIPIYAHPGVKVPHLTDSLVKFQPVTQEPILEAVPLTL
jgi:hypothetical protein